MSGAALSINSSIIGISFDRMNAAKKKIYRAQEEAQGERDSLSRAISSLQVEDGRLRQKAEALNRLRSRINNRMTDLQRMGSHVEYAVQRFKEVDNQRAQKIKTGGCAVRKAVGIPKESGIFGNIVSGLVSIVDRGARAWYNTNKAMIDGAKFIFGKGWEAIKYGAKAVGDFYEDHKVLINNIATIALEVASIALTVAAVTALSVTGVGLVVAVGIAAAGIAYSASNIIDSGVKIYNYCTTGEEKGFNPLQKGFQAVLGDELGEKVYNYTGIAVAVADVGAGAVSMIKAAKQAKTAFSLTKSVKEAGNVLKEFGQKGIQQLKNTAKEMVESGSQLFKKSESLVDAATGTRFSDKMLDFGKVDMPVVEKNAVQRNYNAIVNGTDTGLSGASDDFAGMLRGEKVQLPGVKTKEINYTKRMPEEAEKLRKAFDNTEKKKFLQNLTEDIEKLKKAGLSDSDIARMKDGLNPKGWQVHHKLPLDDGGTNAMDNLILIKNEPYHKTITNFQNTFAKQLNAGEVKKVEWPIPEGNIYPPNN